MVEVKVRACTRCKRLIYKPDDEEPRKGLSLTITLTNEEGEDKVVKIDDLCRRCAGVCLRAIDRMVKKPKRRAKSGGA